MEATDRIVEAQIWDRKAKELRPAIAVFRGWGMDYEEFESGSVPFSIAIVELEDGRIEMPRADRVRFLTPAITSGK